MILHWFKLIRPVNLIILVLTQYFLNIFLLIPNFNTYGILFSLDAFHFFLLILSTVLICAGGNIINDYYDVKADAINKPDKQIVGKYISQKAALTGYWVITICGLLLGVYLAYKVGNIKLATVQGVCILLLYFYSYSYKRILLLGNLVVALLTALSILIIGVFEPHLYNLQREGDYYIAGLCWKYIIGISLFAFLLTLVREIIKDIEDMEGDNHIYVNSIPIAWGVNAAKGIICAILLSVIGLTGYIIFFGMLKGNTLYLNYAVVLMIILAYCFYIVIKAKEKKDFSFLSLLAKVCMLIGILFFPVYYFVNF
ncbi:MAG: geranylgeranylglycerol-phosphate geranylgeranyltransferase [Fimbriimonadaceae bacterium]|nr:geranylgeranylglycerol-phosphate geranylgeranyltransferase [Chitinophagales bacterium]